MSTFEDMAVTCGHCGAEKVHAVAKSIHGPRAPEAVAAILAGTFQHFECEQCAESYVAEHPLVFIDFEAKVWIYMYPRQWEDRWPALESQSRDSWRTNMIDNAPPLVRDISGGFRLRTVFGLGALREKLLCFEAGLDDVTVELLKLNLLRSTPGLIVHPSARPVLDAVGEDGLVFIAQARQPDEAAAHVRLETSRAQYDAIRHDPVAWSAVHGQVSAGNYVDLGRIMLKQADEDPAATP